ncbi:MAG: hypothetical protein R3C99_14360 [Pirellulaceae bacterium]
MLRSFEWYVRRYLRTHFDRVLLDRGGSEPSRLIGERPLVVYLNHASWWDPLIGLIIARTQFPQRQHFAPIDAKALEQFRFFSRLGFLESSSRLGQEPPSSGASARRCFNRTMRHCGSRRKLPLPIHVFGLFVWLQGWPDWLRDLME